MSKKEVIKKEDAKVVTVLKKKAKKKATIKKGKPRSTELIDKPNPGAGETFDTASHQEDMKDVKFGPLTPLSKPRIQGFAMTKGKTTPPFPKKEEKPEAYVNTGKVLKPTYRMAMRVQGDYELQAQTMTGDEWSVLAYVKNEEEARTVIGQINPPFIGL